MKNERINLTPGYCKDLKPKDKEYIKSDKNWDSRSNIRVSANKKNVIFW